MKNKVKNSTVLAAALSLGLLSLTSCSTQMGNNAAIGAAAGGAAGYAYDQYQKSGEGNSRAWDGDTTRRALTGAGLGAATGAVLTPQQQQQPQQTQQPPNYYR